MENPVKVVYDTVHELTRAWERSADEPYKLRALRMAFPVALHQRVSVSLALAWLVLVLHAISLISQACAPSPMLSPARLPLWRIQSRWCTTPS